MTRLRLERPARADLKVRTAILRNTAIVAAGILLLSGVVQTRLDAGQQAPPQPPAVFRSTADSVTVDVSVRDGRSPLAGLTPDDFAVTDNGVAQRVESVDSRAMPIDVTIVADVSDKTRGAWTNVVSPAENVKRVNYDVHTIATILRPDDRIRLLASNTSVQQVFPMQAPSTVVVGVMETQGLSSTFDALVAAMLRPVEATRRHLVIAWVKPTDTISTSDASTLREVARRSDAVLHVVERSAELRAGTANTSGYSPMTPFQINLLELQVRTWRPYLRNDAALLPEVVGLTGGTMHSLGIASDPNVADEFKEIFEEFRRGYVLRYSLQGVRREGWHEISVTVPKSPHVEIRARRGYAIESSTPKTMASARPAAAAVGAAGSAASASAGLDALVSTFDRGEYAAVQSRLQQTPDLRRVIRDFRSAGNPWPATPRREALFALELVNAALVGRDNGTRDDAIELLREFASLVRSPLKDDPFECRWYEVAVGALEGGLHVSVAEDLIPRFVARCPADARLQLARAFVSDQAASIRTTAVDASRADLTPAMVDAILAKYDDAAKFIDVAREAYVRAAWFSHRAGRLDRAMTYLAAVKPPGTDRALDYFGEIVRGQVLRAQGRFDDAIAAFRAALAIWPGGQSARVGLMMLLVTHGDRREGEALAEAVQADQGARVDPWWLYWQGDYRLLSVFQGDLREMSR